MLAEHFLLYSFQTKKMPLPRVILVLVLPEDRHSILLFTADTTLPGEMFQSITIWEMDLESVRTEFKSKLCHQLAVKF